MEDILSIRVVVSRTEDICPSATVPRNRLWTRSNIFQEYELGGFRDPTKHCCIREWVIQVCNIEPRERDAACFKS